jgi:hypothetical protein
MGVSYRNSYYTYCKSSTTLSVWKIWAVERGGRAADEGGEWKYFFHFLMRGGNERNMWGKVWMAYSWKVSLNRPTVRITEKETVVWKWRYLLANLMRLYLNRWNDCDSAEHWSNSDRVFCDDIFFLLIWPCEAFLLMFGVSATLCC